MTATQPCPAAALPREWRGLDRELSRRWRRGRAADERAFGSAMRRRVGGRLARATSVAAGQATAVIIEFDDGWQVRLLACDRLAAERLVNVAGSEAVLVRVMRPGGLWYLEFNVGDAVLALFAGHAGHAGPGGPGGGGEAEPVAHPRSPAGRIRRSGLLVSGASNRAG